MSNSASTKNLNGTGESMNHESIDDKIDENHLNNSMTNARLQLNSLCAEINHVLLGQQMTCEILTNLCCDVNDNDSENWEDDSDEACSSDMVRFFNELTRALAEKFSKGIIDFECNVNSTICFCRKNVTMSRTIQ